MGIWRMRIVKKRLLSVMLAGVMMFSLAACGNSAEDSNTDETKKAKKQDCQKRIWARLM